MRRERDRVKGLRCKGVEGRYVFFEYTLRMLKSGSDLNVEEKI